MPNERVERHAGDPVERPSTVGDLKEGHSTDSRSVRSNLLGATVQEHSGVRGGMPTWTAIYCYLAFFALALDEGGLILLAFAVDDETRWSQIPCCTIITNYLIMRSFRRRPNNISMWIDVPPLLIYLGSNQTVPERSKASKHAAKTTISSTVIDDTSIKCGAL